MSAAQIAQGETVHQRMGTAARSFRYPTFFFRFDTRNQERLAAELRTQFWGGLSVRAADYLRGATGSIDSAVRTFLREECCFEADEVFLVTMPRVLGYVFNPVSFWLCRRAGKLEAALCEVNNTFGERHFYWIPPTAGGLAGWREARKVFHVSPFLPVEGFYRFHFRDAQETLRIDVNYHSPGGELVLATWLTGELSDLSSATLPRILLRYGWHTALVVARIHWQAIALWRSGLRFFPKPAPASKGVSQ